MFPKYVYHSCIRFFGKQEGLLVPWPIDPSLFRCTQLHLALPPRHAPPKADPLVVCLGFGFNKPFGRSLQKVGFDALMVTTASCALREKTRRRPTLSGPPRLAAPLCAAGPWCVRVLGSTRRCQSFSVCSCLNKKAIAFGCLASNGVNVFLGFRSKGIMSCPSPPRTLILPCVPPSRPAHDVFCLEWTKLLCFSRTCPA